MSSTVLSKLQIMRKSGVKGSLNAVTVLLYCLENPGCYQIEIAEKMEIDISTVSHSMQRLNKFIYVKGTPQARGKAVHLTQAGQRLANTLNA